MQSNAGEGCNAWQCKVDQGSAKQCESMKRIGIRSNVMRANKIGQFKAMQRNEIYAASVACPVNITRDNR